MRSSRKNDSRDATLHTSQGDVFYMKDLSAALKNSTKVCQGCFVGSGLTACPDCGYSDCEPHGCSNIGRSFNTIYKKLRTRPLFDAQHPHFNNAENPEYYFCNAPGNNPHSLRGPAGTVLSVGYGTIRQKMNLYFTSYLPLVLDRE